MQVMLGVSNTSDEELAQWEGEVLTSNDEGVPVDDGIEIGGVESWSENSDSYLSGPDVVRYMDEILILENGQNIFDQIQHDIGNGPEVSGGNRDGGAREQAFAPGAANHAANDGEELIVFRNVHGDEANGLEHRIHAEPNSLDDLGENSGLGPK